MAGEARGTEPGAIRAAWRAIVSNFDGTLSTNEMRDYLAGLSAHRFHESAWLEALQDRRSREESFFQAFPYEWCDRRGSFDFPIEASLQMRALDAAIGLWRASIHDKPNNPALGRIVARSTFLPRFRDATPHVQAGEAYDFVVCPMGWTEFTHRYFAGFAKVWPAQSEDWGSACRDDWLGIAANMIASAVARYDYFLPTMINAICQQVEEFRSAPAHLSAVHEAAFSQDLAYATLDFALCHEVAHIAARDFKAPDERRADRWGVAAYFASDHLRLPLHEQIVTLEALRTAIGPFAFGSALRSLLASRAFIAKRLKQEQRRIDGYVRTFSAAGERSRGLFSDVESRVSALVPQPDADFHRDKFRVDSLFAALLDYETAFGESLHVLSESACQAAQAVAMAAEAEAIASPS